MELLIPDIKRLAENIRSTEISRMETAKVLRSLGDEINLIKKSEPANIDKIKIAGIDGGIVKKAFHGFDFILARAAAVNFEFLGGKISNASYYPSKTPTPRLFTLESVSDIDYAYYASIVRQKLEIETAKKAVEIFKPDILLLDGSIVPHYATKPSQNSLTYKDYEELMSSYQELYKICQENKILLAGVVEDSRNERYCNLVKQNLLRESQKNSGQIIEVLAKSRDTSLLFWVLEEHERTKTFDYSDDFWKHPILKDFVFKNFYSFYLKTARMDRPIRVDFMDKEKDDWLSSVLLSISGQHSRYGFPSVIIEADNIAKMSEQEIDNFYSYMLKYTGNIPSMMKLRREQRPF